MRDELGQKDTSDRGPFQLTGPGFVLSPNMAALALWAIHQSERSGQKGLGAGGFAKSIVGSSDTLCHIHLPYLLH